MDIRNAQDARAWIRAWNGRPRPGILKAALDGLHLAASLAGAAEAKKLRAAAKVVAAAGR